MSTAHVSRSSRTAQAKRGTRRVSAQRAAQRRRPRMSRLLAWLLSAVLGSLGFAHAQVGINTLPMGGRVVVGSGTVQQQGSSTLVITQATPKLGMDWQSFNIGSAALVEFVQPGADSVALNRVVGNSGSEIYGRLHANGQVFLVNPSGILFAPGSKVDVGGLVASTLDLSQQDFSQGRYNFNASGASGRSAAVVNQGELRANAGGYLALFGNRVDNQGTVQVDRGSVVLASGRAATVSISGSGLISAVVTAGDAGSVSNSGSILADGGVVTMTAQSAEGVARSLVNNTGIIRANTLVERNGEVWITGDSVSTSGSITADAPAGGDAGRIKVLGDMLLGQAVVDGTLSAQSAEGRGGQIETSAAQVQVRDGARVSTLGAAGRHGTWTIDPTDFTVSAGSAAQTSSGIGATTLGNALDAGGVSIATAAGGSEPGDIHVDAPVSWSGSTQLSLTANRNVNVNADITASGSSASLAVTTGTGGTLSVASGHVISLPGAQSGYSRNGTGYTMVRNVAGLQAVDGNSAALAGNYALAVPLDLTGLSFSPIGNEGTSGISTSNSFGGRFEGLGQTITGLSFNPSSTGTGGLFATTNGATISNLRLSGFSLNGGFAVGTLAGVASNTTVINVAGSGTVQTSINAYVGGLIGQASSAGTITGSSAAVAVSSSHASSYVGGLVGETNAAIRNSSASGTVGGGVRTGGLVGSYAGSVVDGSSASGNVSSTVAGADVGGLLGYAVSTGTLSNSSATGNVSAASNADSVGGLVGQFQLTGGISNVTAGASGSTVSGGNNTGGVLGWTGNTSTTSFNNAGSGAQFAYLGASVSGTQWVGGLIGQSTSSATMSGVNGTASVSATSNAGGAGGLAGNFAGSVSTSIASGSVSGGGSMGGLIGRAGGAVGTTISNSIASGIVTGNFTTASSGFAGGLVGEVNGTNLSITGSTANGNVSGAGTVGGLVGYGNGALSITNSTARGDATGVNNGGGSVGGLVGYFFGAGSITGSRAEGTVSTGQNVGGFVGYWNSGTTLSGANNVVATGSISGGTWVGGVVGQAAGAGVIDGFSVGAAVTSAQNAGGLVGYAAALVSNSSSTGAVSGGGSSYVGGVVGQAGAGVSNVFASGTVDATGNNSSAGGVVGYVSNGSVVSSVAQGAVTINGTSGSAGGLVGHFSTSTGSITSSSATGRVMGGINVGGLVGYFNVSGTSGGAITNSFATGDVSTTTTGGDVGGLVGYALSNAGALTNSYATGNVTAPAGADRVGGLVGQFQMRGGISGIVHAGAAANGNVAATTVSGGNYTGGVLGWTDNASSTSFVTNSGNNQQFAFLGSAVSGSNWVGGLVGQSTGTATFNGVSSAAAVTTARNTTSGAGGIAGYVAGAVTNAQATGNVGITNGSTGTGIVYLGGLIGQAGGSTAYTISGSSASGAVTGNYSSSSAGGYGGGLLGQVAPGGGPGVSVSNSTASGNVSGVSTAGGLVGYTSGGGGISGSTATGSVSGTNLNAGSVGGLVGEYRMSGDIAGSRADGAVSSAYYVGGLVGYSSTAGTIGSSTVNQTGTISGGAYVGGVVGHAAGSGTIDGFTTTVAVSAGSVTNPQAVGGVAGYSAGPVTNSHASGAISGNANTNVGGLVGWSRGGVSNSTATGTVTQTGNNASVGGLVGYMDGGSISGSTASGGVSSTGTDPSVGGLVGGFVSSGGSISGSQASGNVSGGNNAGGLVGYFTSGTLVSNSSATGNVQPLSTAPNAGGLIGFAGGSGRLQNNSASGSVTSTATSGNLGGAVGWYQLSGTLTGLSAGGNVSGGATAGGVIGYLNAFNVPLNPTTVTLVLPTTGQRSITSAYWTGGYVGYSDSTQAISGLSFTGNVTGTTTSGAAGGIAGRSNGPVNNNSSAGLITGINDMGGLVGEADGAGGFSGNTSSARVNNTGSSGRVGGLVGDYVNTGALQGVTGVTTATGNVSGGVRTGGLVGFYNSAAGLSNASASGNVSGTTYVGGLVGDFVGNFSGQTTMTNVTASGNVSGTQYVGGMVGSYYASGAATGLLATGNVTSNQDAGGLIGLWQNSGTLSDSEARGNVSGGYRAGGAIGYGSSNTLISNVTARGAVQVNSATTTVYAGGLAGSLDQTNITLSVARGPVTAVTNSGAYVGGLVGYLYNSNTGSFVSNSSASGALRVDSSGAWVGGLIGQLAYATASQSTATGTVTVTDSRNTGGSQYVGGLLGYMYGSGGISDSSATASVTANYAAGGLVGYSDATGTIINSSASGHVVGGSYAGGLLGYNSSAGIQSGAATGNVRVTSNSYAGGLVGYQNLANGSSISDSRASGTVSGGNYVGGLVGYLGDYNATTVGATVSNSTASGSVSGSYAAGGLVGYWNWGAGSAPTNRASRSLSGSVASGPVTGGIYSGGAVGYMVSYGGIQGSAATGLVTANGSGGSDFYAGGLVGYFQNQGTLTNASTGQISGSYATGAVTTGSAVARSNFTNSYLGGLVGYARGPSTASFVNIRDSYAAGAVTQTATTGRLHTGGLVAYTDRSIANSYATGLVTASTPNGSVSDKGGLVSQTVAGTSATNSFWATDSTGQTTSALGSASTLTGLQTASTFTGWDLSTTGGSTSIWRLYAGLSTPLLRSFLTPLTLSLVDVSKVYDGTTGLGSGAISIGGTGVLHPERILVGSIPVDVGTYALTASNLYSVHNGYDLSLSGTANLTINARPLSFSGTVANKVYDGTRTATFSTNLQLSGLVAGEDLLFTPGSNFTGLFDTKNVGNNKTVTLSGSFTLADGTNGKASNYLAPSTLASTANITPATVTAGSFTAVNRAYDGTTTVAVSATSGAVTGVVAGDQVTVDLSGVSSGTMADKNVGTGKLVTLNGIQLSGADAGNYVVAGAGTTTVDISQRPITVNGITASDRAYNANRNISVNANAAVLGGAVSGDSVQLQTLSLSGTMADKNVGNGKAVTVSGLGLRGLDAANYSVQQGAVAVNISPYLLTVFLNRTGSTDRIYDGTSNAAAVIPVSWYSGDNLTATAASISYADKNVAYTSGGAVTSKLVTASGITISGSDAANYSLQNTTATTSGTISPKALTVSGVTAVNRVYDGTRNVTVNIAGATVDTTAVVSGDVVGVATPGSGTVTGLVATKNVGNNKAVTVPGLSLTGADAANYTITGSGSGVTVNVTQKDLTAVYTGVNKVYDGSTGAYVSVTSPDIVSGDVVSFYADQSYFYSYYYYNAYADRNVGQSKAISITGNGLYNTDAANYRLLNPNGTTTANITPKPVTLAFSAPSKVYDGTTNATVAINIGNSGMYSVDAITSTQDAQFTGTGAKNVGTSKPISVSNIVVGGSGAGNYTFNNTTATTVGNVTAKPITVSGISGVDRPYDGTTTVAVVAGTVGSAGFVSGDNVSVTLPSGGLSTGTIANKNVGTAKPVTVTGLGLSGTDAGNYSIDSTASGITVNITAAALTPTYTAVDRVYNGGVTAQVTSTTSGILSGDTVTFSQQAVYTGTGAKDVGTNKPISVTNITLGGANAANYSLASTTATTTGGITPKPVTVTFVGSSRVYDGLTDVTANVIGTSLQFVAGDQVSTSQSAVFTGDGSVGSNKAVTISGITLTGAQAANYSLLNTTGSTTASITPRSLGVTGITATSRVYDGTTTVAVNLNNASVDTSSVIAGDDVTPVLPTGGSTTGSVADRNVGNGKAVTVTGITLAGAQASNYALVGATGLTVNITPKSVTAVYAAADKVYDGSSVAAISGSSADFLAVDSGQVSLSAQGLFTDGKNVGTNKAVGVSGGFLTGSSRDNYLLINTSGSSTASITPRTLSVAYNGGSRVYDGGVTAPVSATLGNRVAGDLVGVAQVAEFTGTGARNVGSNKPITVSGMFLTGADAGNYTLGSTTSVNTTGTITAKPITVGGLSNVTALDRVYDATTTVQVSVPSGVTLTPNSNDIVTGDTVTINVPGSGLTTGTMADKNVGTGKAVSVTGLTLSGADAGNYSIAGTAGITVTITPLAISALWAGVNKVYDGTAAATAIGSSVSVLAGDSLLISGSGVFTGTGAKNVGTAKDVNITSGTLSGSDARNYSLQTTTGTTTADITARSITPNYNGGTRVYDGGTSAPVTSTVSGFVAGDSVALSQTAVFTGSGARNAGTNKPVAVSGISLTGADASNYALTATTATTSASITPKPLVLLGLSGLTAVNRAYDGTRNVSISVASTGTISIDSADLISGDVVSVLAPTGSTTTGTVANKNVGIGKAVTVTGLSLSGTDAANYSIAASGGLTVDITPLAVTANWVAASRVYDGTTAAQVTGTSSGTIAGDVLSFSATGTFTDGKNVGTAKPVTVSAGRLTGADAANYSLINPSGSSSATVTQRSATATYTGGTKIYDGTLNAPVSGTLANLVSGDSVTLAQTAVFTGDKNVGTGKAVSVSGITLSGTDAANYSLTAGNASTTANIMPRPLHLIGLTGVTAADRVYDGTRNVVVTVATTGTVTADPNDLVSGDVVTVTAPPAGTTTGTMADKNVGSNKAVSVTGLTLGGADAVNYSVAATTGVTVNITPRQLTAVYTGVDRSYDGTVAAAVLMSAAGAVTGDSLTLTASGSFADKNVGTAKAITVSNGTLGGADAANYTLLNNSGSATANVTPRALTASYVGATKVYDGTAAATVTRTLTGLLAGDTLSVSESASFAGGATARNVGNNKSVTVSGITLSGTDAANYALVSSTANTVGSITPRPLTVSGLSGITAVDRVYDGTTAVSLNAPGTLGSASGDALPGDQVAVVIAGGGIGSGTLLNKNAGQNKPVVLSGLSLSGSDAGNYFIAGTTGLTVNIAPKPLTALFSGVSRVYDGTTNATVLGGSAGIIGGDSVSIAGTGQFTGTGAKNVGTGKTVSITGAALSGADAANYTLTSTTGQTTADITPRTLTATWTGGTREYDGTVTAPVTVSIANLVAGDQAQVTDTARFTDSKNVGTNKPVAITGIALSGADAGNYVLAGGTTASTTASVTQRALTVSGLTGITAQDRVYDGTTAVVVNIPNTLGSATGDIIAGDNVTVTLPGSGITSASMLDKNAGQNKAVVLNGLSLSGADAGNYRIAGTLGLTVNIAQRPLSISGVTATDRVYDGTTTVAIDTSAGTLSGAVAGDNVQLLTSGVTGSVADKHVGNAKAVTVTGLALSGTDLVNYNVTSGPGLTVNITPRTLTPTVAVVDKVYDGTTGATVTLADNRVSGDVLTLTANATYASSHAGSGIAVTLSGLTLAGTDAGDYRLSTTQLAGTGSITRRDLTITPNAMSKVYGDTATLSATAFSTGAGQLVSGETIGGVTLASAGAVATAAVQGSPYSITASNATGGSFDASNYALTYGSGLLTVRARPVTVAAKGLVLASGSALPAPNSYEFSTSAGGLVGGDSLASVTIQPQAAPGYYSLQASNAVFNIGAASNYALSYTPGVLLALPPQPAVGETSGGGGNGFAVTITPQERADALDALQQALQATAGIGKLRNRTLTTTAPLVSALQNLTPDDLALLLSGDARKLNVPDLLKLPLISFDPELRRLMQSPETTPSN